METHLPPKVPHFPCGKEPCRKWWMLWNIKNETIKKTFFELEHFSNNTSGFHNFLWVQSVGKLQFSKQFLAHMFWLYYMVLSIHQSELWSPSLRNTVSTGKPQHYAESTDSPGQFLFLCLPKKYKIKQDNHH